MALRNIALLPRGAHNSTMDLSGLFLGFLHTVALGSAAVFVLFGIVRLRTPHRSPALLSAKPSR